MENTIEIQKEFEILVSELERLKSINELTSSNSKSAQNMIIEFKKFIIKANSYINKVEEKFNSSTVKLANSVDLILKQHKEIDKNTTEQCKLLSLELNKIIESTSDFLRINQDKVVDAYNQLNSSSEKLISESSSNIKLEFELIRSALSEVITSAEKLTSYISSLKIAQKFERIGKNIADINAKYDSLKESIFQLKKEVQDSRRQTHDIEHKIVGCQKQNFQSIIEKFELSTTKTVEFQNKLSSENKTLKTLVFVSIGISIIGILTNIFI